MQYTNTLISVVTCLKGSKCNYNDTHFINMVIQELVIVHTCMVHYFQGLMALTSY